ncbi:MAG: hypothetical protein R2713_20550 [Ilumatobacteraceae bacterium]
MLGPDTQVILQLLGSPGAEGARGVRMGSACAFPLLADIVCTDGTNVAFGDADVALLVGDAQGRHGRADLLTANGGIFNPRAPRCRPAPRRTIISVLLVVWQPLPTPTYIAAERPDLDLTPVLMTRLDTTVRSASWPPRPAPR